MRLIWPRLPEFSAFARSHGRPARSPPGARCRPPLEARRGQWELASGRERPSGFLPPASHFLLTLILSASVPKEQAKKVEIHSSFVGRNSLAIESWH